MAHRLIQDVVDIHQYPQESLIDKLGSEDLITLGDMHGNALKLLYALIRHQFVNLPSHDFEEFKTIYYTPSINAETLHQFEKILSRMTILSQAKKCHLRLLGDLLADRGSNDYFTLMLLDKLHQHQVPFDIIISNHDAELIAAYENKTSFGEGLLDPIFRMSAINLQKLIDNKLILREKVNELIEISYLPHLQLCAYSIDEFSNQISLYTHALAGDNSILKIHEYLLKHEPHYRYKTGQKIEIDEINRVFSLYKEKKEVTKRLNIESVPLMQIDNFYPIDMDHFPFAHIIWNRREEEVVRSQNRIYIHGHDSSEKTSKNVINLDSELGKSPSAHVGEFLVLHSTKEK